jgi:hypothetical protein
MFFSSPNRLRDRSHYEHPTSIGRADLCDTSEEAPRE